jgi:hypothetical protein
MQHSPAAQTRAGGLEAIMATGPPAIERLTKIIVNTNNNINRHNNSIQHIYIHIHFSDQQKSDQNQNDE